MGIRRGSISTPIIADGLVFNMDAANRASTIPSTNTTKTFNTLDLSQSGSIVTDATWEAGSPPTFDFDGSDAKIETNFNSANFTSLTVSNWVYRSTGGTHYLANQWVEGSASTSAWGINTHVNKAYFFVRAGSSSPTIFGSSTLNSGVWLNICGVWDGSQIHVYVNGIADATPQTCASMNNSSVNMSIGASTNNLYYLNGNINNVHIYNRALSANEVLHNYNALKSRFE